MEDNISEVTNSTGGPGLPYSRSMTIVLGIILFTIVTLAIIGNVLVIVAVLSFKRLRDNVTNYFIISLAVADLMVSTFVMPFNAVFELLGTWPFGIGFCDVYISLDILCCTASILNLCVISLDRYLAITSPFTYYERITRKTAGVLIAGVWIVSFLISALPVNLDFHIDPELEKEGFYSDPEFCVLGMNPTFALVSSIVSFYIPMFIIMFVYSRIFIVARRQARQIAAYENTAKRFTGVSKKTMARERKAAKTLAIIVGVFIACWLPFFIVNVVDPFCRCVDLVTITIFVWLGFVNSMANPIIYAQNKLFRRAFKSLLWCHKCQGIQFRDTDTSDAENTAMTNAPAQRRKSEMSTLPPSQPISRVASTVAISTISPNIGSTTTTQVASTSDVNKVKQTMEESNDSSENQNNNIDHKIEIEPVKPIDSKESEQHIKEPAAETIPDANSQESPQNASNGSSNNHVENIKA